MALLETPRAKSPNPLLGQEEYESEEQKSSVQDCGPKCCKRPCYCEDCMRCSL